MIYHKNEKNKKCRHHLLEILFYFDTDGNKIFIQNSVEKLKKLKIYDEYKLCITITKSEHFTLHRKETKMIITNGKREYKF